MAYRYLARNQPIPAHVNMALQGKRPDGAPQCSTPPPSNTYSQTSNSHHVSFLRTYNLVVFQS